MSVCDVPLIAEVCNSVGEGTASLIAAPFDWLANAVGSAAAWMFETVWSAFDTTTLVDLTDPAYLRVLNVLFGVAVFVTLLLFCLQLISGVVRRDPSALSRAALGAAKSVLGSFVINGGFLMGGSNLLTKKSRKPVSFRDIFVGLTGFEPATP